MDLVGGIATHLKNMSQLGLLFPIYGNYKMFSTTNQTSPGFTANLVGDF